MTSSQGSGSRILLESISKIHGIVLKMFAWRILAGIGRIGYHLRMNRIAADIRIPLLILALVVQVFLLLYLGWTTSPNRTELGHMAAALRWYETASHDLFHVNPPLPRILIGSTVARFIAPLTDWSDYSSDPTQRSEWATGIAFVKANDIETVRNSFFIGRVVCIPFVLLGGVFGFLFGHLP